MNTEQSANAAIAILEAVNYARMTPAQGAALMKTLGMDGEAVVGDYDEAAQQAMQVAREFQRAAKTSLAAALRVLDPHASVDPSEENIYEVGTRLIKQAERVMERGMLVEDAYLEAAKALSSHGIGMEYTVAQGIELLASGTMAQNVPADTQGMPVHMGGELSMVDWYVANPHIQPTEDDYYAGTNYISAFDNITEDIIKKVYGLDAQQWAEAATDPVGTIARVVQERMSEAVSATVSQDS